MYLQQGLSYLSSAKLQEKQGSLRFSKEVITNTIMPLATFSVLPVLFASTGFLTILHSCSLTIYVLLLDIRPAPQNAYGSIFKFRAKEYDGLPIHQFAC